MRFSGIPSWTTLAEKLILYITSREIPVQGDLLEIGPAQGGTSIVLAAGNEASRVKGNLWLVGPIAPNEEKFLNNFRAFNLEKRLKLVGKLSKDARKTVNSKFRFIFVDGNHGYDGVKNDILNWQDCLEEGGIIAFHDYFHPSWPGIRKAVEEFIEKSDKFVALGTIDSMFFARKDKFNDTDLLCHFQKVVFITNELHRLARWLKVFGKRL